MSKRVFERRDGLVIDSYEDPPGQRCTYQGPASKLGESPERAVLLAAVAGEDGPEPFKGVLALMEDHSSDLLESLLEESPSLRFHAVERLLPLLSTEARRELAMEALAEEPDEGLRWLLQRCAVPG